MSRYRLTVCMTLLPTMLVGCYGQLAGDRSAGQLSAQDSNTEGSNPGVVSNASTGTSLTAEKNHLPQASSCSTADTPAPRQLRRLTQAELNATLQTLFSDPNAPQVKGMFTNDPELYTFHNAASMLVVAGISATQLQSMAEASGAYAMQNAARLSPTCATTDTACETTFITNFGTRAFRSPLTSDQVSAYLTLMQPASSFATGVGIVVDAMLQSPYFLYRSELGVASGNTYKLTPYEVAAELSYLIVGSMPDSALLQAAQNGTIMDANTRTAQVTRLLADPRAHGVIDTFFLQWLGVADLPSYLRTQGNVTLSPTLAAEMVQETTQSIDALVFASNGVFSDMHSTQNTYLNSDLASFYGLSGGSQNFAQVSIAGRRDTGILNQGGVLSAASEVNIPSPVLRGRMLREHILCQTLPPPPQGVPVVSGVPQGSTTRDVYAAHVTNSVCSSCHNLMDPLGFTQGAYDTLGRPFASKIENGAAINTQGVAGNMLDGAADMALADATSLSSYVATSAQAKSCFARHWAMYGLGNVSWAQDSCTYQAIDSLASASNYNFLQTVSALTAVRSFTERVQDP